MAAYIRVVLAAFYLALNLFNHLQVARCCIQQDFLNYTTPKDADYNEKKGDMVQYRKGDIIIAGIFDLHDHDENLKCSTINLAQFQKLEAFNMILEETNANPDILPGIKLGSIVVDSCNLRIHGTKQMVKTFFSSAFDTELLVGAVEATSSAVSLQIMPIIEVLDLVQIGTETTADDRNRFPHLFRTVPSDTHQVKAILQMIKQLGWKYASIVYENSVRGQRAYTAMKLDIEEYGICLATSQVIVDNTNRNEYEIMVQNLLIKRRAKAVILIASWKDSEKMMKAAEKNPQARGHFIWIGMDNWFGNLPSDTSYLPTLNNSIVMQLQETPVKRLATHMAKLSLKQHLDSDSQKVGRNPWFAEYYQEIKKCSINQGSSKKVCSEDETIEIDVIPNTESVGDATLALVNSLDKFVRNHCKSSDGLCDSVVNRNSTYLVTQLIKLLKSETFTGINGEEVEFDENQDWLPSYDLYVFRSSSQYSKTHWINAGNYCRHDLDLGEEFDMYKSIAITCSDECEMFEKRVYTSKCCWTCVPCKDDEIVIANDTQCHKCQYLESPSLDRRFCETLPIRGIHSGIFYVTYGISIVGILSTLLIALIYFNHRTSPIVRASGIELCACIWIGSILSFVNGFVTNLPISPHVCLLLRVLNVSGLTLQYAALLVKTLRVVIVFRTRHFLSEPVKRILRPRFQLLFTFVLFIMNIFILIVWSINNDELTSMHRDDELHPTAVYHLCADVGKVEVLVVIAFPFILMFLSLILATINRDVPEGFNETKVIGFATYAVFITGIAFIGINLSNQEVNSMRMISSTLCVNCNSLVLIISLFAYRCHVIVFQPERNNRNDVMKVSRNPDSVHVSSSRPSNSQSV